MFYYYVFYPNTYGHFEKMELLKKQWTVLYSFLLQRLRIQFISFDIEDHSTCSWDYLELTEGNVDDAIHLGRLCGSTLPYGIVSKSNYLRLVFHSDHIVPKAGFKAIISTEGMKLICCTKRSKDSNIRYDENLVICDCTEKKTHVSSDRILVIC